MFSSLFGSSTINNIDIKERDGKVELFISFGNPYSGIVTRKSGNTIQKIILNSAVIDKKYSHPIEDNELISKIDFLPFADRTDILLSMLKGGDISHMMTADDMGMIITVSDNMGFQRGNNIETNGQSAIELAPSSYWITITILIIGVVILIAVKKRVVLKNYSSKILSDTPNNELDWLLDKSNQKISLKSIQTPSINFKTRPNPKKEFEFETNFDLSQKINDLEPKENIFKTSFNKIVSPLKEKKKKEMEEKELKQPTFKNSEAKREVEPPFKAEQKFENKSQNPQQSFSNFQNLPKESGNVKVLFDDKLEIGRVFKIVVDKKSYTILQNSHGETTILDIQNLDQKKNLSTFLEESREFSKKVEIKEKEPIFKNEVTKREEISKEPKEFSFDIKIPVIEDEVSKPLPQKKVKERVENNDNDNNDLKDLFKDSSSLKV
jgi:hypothetical protein